MYSLRKYNQESSKALSLSSQHTCPVSWANTKEWACNLPCAEYYRIFLQTRTSPPLNSRTEFKHNGVCVWMKLILVKINFNLMWFMFGSFYSNSKVVVKLVIKKFNKRRSYINLPQFKIKFRSGINSSRWNQTCEHLSKITVAVISTWLWMTQRESKHTHT